MQDVLVGFVYEATKEGIGRMMAGFMKWGVCAVAVGIVSVMFSGCSLFPSGNTVVVHGSDQINYYNAAFGDYRYKLQFFSAVRVPDECSNDTPEGANLLTKGLGSGEKVRLGGFQDGRYYCVYKWQKGAVPEGSGYITVGGGQTLDVRPTPSL